jgi:transposase
VAKEAALPSSAGMEHIIAKKYDVKPWTVIKWRDAYLSDGEEGLSKGNLSGRQKTSREIALEKENAALREEVEILKKAAAFLANVKRD